MKKVRLLHTGDLGDCIAALPILRHLGGGDIVITEDKTEGPGRRPRETMRGARFASILPLLRAQEYVKSVIWQDYPTFITHDLSHFRTLREWPRENLIEWQARFLGLKDVSQDPWLRVVPNTECETIFCRSLRYYNYFFPWQELIREHPEAVFCGLQKEHEVFQLETHREIPFRPTKDLYELAQLIVGANLTVCNQSAPYWLAAGLGARLIQESWEVCLNSIVRRDNAIYTATGPETRTLIMRLYPKQKKRLAKAI